MPPRAFELDLWSVRKRLARDGWQTTTTSGAHDVYKHPDRSGRIVVPRGRGDLPVGTARAIAKAAGWIKSEDVDE